MLNAGEKAFCQALVALKARDYQRATDYFDQAAPFFPGNQEFVLLKETTALLCAVKEELRQIEEDSLDPTTRRLRQIGRSDGGRHKARTEHDNERIEIEESYYYGQKDGLRPEE